MKLSALMMTEHFNSIANASPESGNLDNLAPDHWWKKMSPMRRIAYLEKHPKSKYRTSHVAETLKNMDEETKKGLLASASKLVGPNSPIAKKFNEVFSEENFKKLSKKAVKDVAGKLKAAKESQAAGKMKEAAKYGFKAGLRLCASLGIMAVMGAGALALGAPVGCFTPDLISSVWKKVDFSEDNPDSLVKSFMSKVRERAEEGYDYSEIEGSMIADVDVTPLDEDGDGKDPQKAEAEAKLKAQKSKLKKVASRAKAKG